MTRARRPTAGVVTLAALDVRRRPDHASEMGSQLLLGEVVRVIRGTAGGRWFLVENLADGYRGWVRSWGLLLAAPRQVAAWQRRARARATALWAEVREAPGRGPLVTPLFWGARVVAGRVQRGFRRVELPDGTRGWVDSPALAIGRRAVPPLLERLRGLLGVPYLWGGRTPTGMDCSGLVQMVLAEHGYRLPRDAGDQERVCRPLGPRRRPRLGDLAFFGPPAKPAAHVGIMIGDDAYVHARGRVRMNSLDSYNTLYDKELGAQLHAIRSPAKRAQTAFLTPRRRG
jgi:gamma-D-glutamyl-L-lysine dipeptidyl-peptidase